MKKAPNLITVDSVIDSANSTHRNVNGKWVPARPMGLYSLVSRLQLAWGVFIGNYDALKWDQQ